MRASPGRPGGCRVRLPCSPVGQAGRGPGWCPVTAAGWLLLALVAAVAVALVWVGVRELRAHDRRRRALDLEDAIAFAEQLNPVRRRHPSTPVEDRPDWPPA